MSFKFLFKGILLEAWVTTAVDDDEAFRALMLAESLKRSATTRKLVVIFGTMVSKMRRYVLHLSMWMVDYQLWKKYKCFSKTQ